MQATAKERRALARLRAVAKQRAGLDLPEEKDTLVSARIRPRLRALGLADSQQYADYLGRDHGGTELVTFIDLVTTNHTSFFREPEHFGMLDELVRRRVKGGQRRLRFWCAAASTGEEPYTIAMTIADALRSVEVDWRLLASDISTRVLAEGADGVYHEARIAEIEASLRSAYFSRCDHGMVSVVSALKSHIVWRRINLIEPDYPVKGPLDAVFCRNVLMYFSQEAKVAVVRRLASLLADHGIIFVGYAETNVGSAAGLEQVARGAFRRRRS